MSKHKRPRTFWMANRQLFLNNNGDVVIFYKGSRDASDIAVTRQELEQIAAESQRQLRGGKPPVLSCKSGYDVMFHTRDHAGHTPGNINIGCQFVTASEIQQVLKLSDAARSKATKSRSRKKKAAHSNR